MPAPTTPVAEFAQLTSDGFVVDCPGEVGHRVPLCHTAKYQPLTPVQRPVPWLLCEGGRDVDGELELQCGFPSRVFCSAGVGPGIPTLQRGKVRVSQWDTPWARRCTPQMNRAQRILNAFPFQPTG